MRVTERFASGRKRNLVERLLDVETEPDKRLMVFIFDQVESRPGRAADWLFAWAARYGGYPDGSLPDTVPDYDRLPRLSKIAATTASWLTDLALDWSLSRRRRRRC